MKYYRRTICIVGGFIDGRFIELYSIKPCSMEWRSIDFHSIEQYSIVGRSIEQHSIEPSTIEQHSIVGPSLSVFEKPQ